MSETVGKKQLINYVQKLIETKNSLFEQLEEEDLVELKQINLGEVKAVDLVVRDMIREFYLSEEDFKGL
ncbi:hypothetical protein [Halalkalibacter krulwichiae]|uniref:Uncharacterized protein n=1 Tax=Halalkalibacter krulwichiae TaxID=199441 RepID=A0A1X9MFS4_9BACI|nr:hypothetical protein [Halalkalibacter krulwichiae]ARK32299.1 hypothetical protein BkAM31D_21910 [Halalkalibacter krulwichiae]